MKQCVFTLIRCWWIVWWIAWCNQLPAQDVTAIKEPLSAEQAWSGRTSIEKCAWCHFQAGNSFAARPTDFCQLNEVQHWLASDRHATSRYRIEPWPANDPRNESSNQLSRQICEKLGYRIDTVSGYQSYCENCLTCHAGYRASAQPAFQSAREGEPGISCLVCHQLDDQKAWIELHSTLSASTSWRWLAPDAKQSHGLRQLASARGQAELCYECHIGDLSQKKFVSHAMYVAGHPPLPSVELNSLIAAMSPHWRDPASLYASLSALPQSRDEYFIQNELLTKTLRQSNQGSPGMAAWTVQATAVGALQAQQHRISMLEQSAHPTSAQHWADYALYDCSACHHGLKAPSWRQRHRQPTPPGRPLPAQWPSILERTVARTCSDSTQSLADNYLRAVTAVPFGERMEVLQTAKAYRTALEHLELLVVERSLEPDYARELLNQLAATEAYRLSDYESARQVALAAQALAQPLKSRPRLQAIVPSLGQSILLPLPGQPQAELVPSYSKRYLELQAQYDPAAFAHRVAELRNAIK